MTHAESTCRWISIILVAIWWFGAVPMNLFAEPQPNVILIMTDDQGYGDLGSTGNPIVRTPHLDALAARSARWERFYVSPVCTPTRAALMTGRYNYRTRAIDTFRGRAMMDPGEVTVAEILREAGYATGIFGKWHLGDSYPLRAMDQGFEEALVHRGGGIGQPSDPPGYEGKYTDPLLFHNGVPEPQTGYCTDVYFREGLKWATESVQRKQPFFLYLPMNCPHDPLEDVPAGKLPYYVQQDFSPERFPTAGQPYPKNADVDKLRRVAAMVENIDDNLGRLTEWLQEQGIANKTLVIFMTDNGRATAGFNAGMRGRKSDVYDGGTRSPFFACFPEQFPPGVRTGRIAAHIDVLPTLLDVCGVALPAGLKLDGRSLKSALTTGQADWPERTLFVQSHRGDVPCLYNHCAVWGERWKLVHPTGFGKETFVGEPQWQLYDMQADPFEQHDVATQQPAIVTDLAKKYVAWFEDVSSTRPDNYAPPRIQLGTPQENPTILTRQEWRGAAWLPNDQGYWEVEPTTAGPYRVRLLCKPSPAAGKAVFKLGSLMKEQNFAANATEVVFENLLLPVGPAQLQAALTIDGKPHGVMFVEVLRK